MATQNISGKIQFRRDTAANWTSKNPTLLAGELGYETDTHKIKVGDGSTAWKSLPYVWKTTVATGSSNGTIAVDGTDVAVKGLGSAAYTDSTAYAAANHNHDGRYIYWGGTASNNSAWTWGTLTVANGYTQHSHLTGSSGCEGGFASKGGQLNMQLDGYFYQNEGKYRCLDTSDSSSFAPASHSHSYLPLSGGTLTGNLTFSGTAPQIYYNGSKANYSLIRFIDNSADGYGNGISIGGGGAVILGGGEAATTMQDTIFGTGGGKGGTEILALCGDGNVDVYSNCQNGAGSAKKFSFNTGGVFQVPTGGSITVGGTAVSLNGHTHNYAGSSSAGGAASSLLNFTAGLNGVAEHNANNIATNGVWYYTANGPAKSLGASTDDGALYSQAYSTAWVGQIAQDYRNGRLFVRGKNNGTWQAWQRIPWYSEVALSSHNQASNTINAMTGYSKPSTTSAIKASDNLNTAIGKLEKALEPDVSLSINDPGGSSVWIEVPVEHLIVGSTTPTDHNAIWIEIIS